jgi:signal peptidase I
MTKERNTIPGIIIEGPPDMTREQTVAWAAIIAEAEAAAKVETAEELLDMTKEQVIVQTAVTTEVNIVVDSDTMPLTQAAVEKPAERRGINLLKDVLSVVVSAIVIAAVLKTFVIDSRIVPTESMLPTIHGGDRVIILKLPYFFGKTPDRLDVVVFAAPAEFINDEDLLKRVIGTPGDTVEVKSGKVYVNGEALIEPYLNAPPLKDHGEVPVPEGCYFMMGDNRNHSRDSTMWNNPYVPFSDIKGKVILCYWPVNHWGLVE